MSTALRTIQSFISASPYGKVWAVGISVLLYFILSKALGIILGIFYTSPDIVPAFTLPSIGAFIAVFFPEFLALYIAVSGYYWFLRIEVTHIHRLVTTTLVFLAIFLTVVVVGFMIGAGGALLSYF